MTKKLYCGAPLRHFVRYSLYVRLSTFRSVAPRSSRSIRTRAFFGSGFSLYSARTNAVLEFFA